MRRTLIAGCRVRSTAVNRWMLCGYTQTDSYCSSGIWGIGECVGEIFLKTSFVEMGIHRAGSFGTGSKTPAAFQAASKQLGFIADYGKDGWDVGTPVYSGDYFMPGQETEGKKALYCCAWVSIDKVSRV